MKSGIVPLRPAALVGVEPTRVFSQSKVDN
jgi:hypothetical protein